MKLSTATLFLIIGGAVYGEEGGFRAAKDNGPAQDVTVS